MKIGDMIRLIRMPDDPNPIEPGTYGIVKGIGTVLDGPKEDRRQQIFVEWDNGRTLILLDGIDEYQIIKEATK